MSGAKEFVLQRTPALSDEKVEQDKSGFNCDDDGFKERWPGTIGSSTLHKFTARPHAEVESIRSWARICAASAMMTWMCTITVEYAKQREQFGKSVATFPAVQDLLIDLAQATTVCNSALSRVFMVLAGEGGARHGSRELVAVSSVFATEALRAIRAGHQVHGAIGMTREFSSTVYSRYLHALRTEIYRDAELRSAEFTRAVQEEGLTRFLFDAVV